MSGKTSDLFFDSGKLANYAWFFGCMALGIAAIIGVARVYCGAKAGKQRLRTSGEAADTRTAENDADQ